MKSRSLLAATLLAAAVIPGCADVPPFPSYAVPEERERVEYGVVEYIELTRAGGGQPSAVGTILGGIAGGVIGHQIGSGRGNTAATIAGALGGAYAGNAIERANEADRYRITVRLDGGARLDFTEVGEGELRVGDRVRVVNHRIYRA